MNSTSISIAASLLAGLLLVAALYQSGAAALRLLGEPELPVALDITQETGPTGEDPAQLLAKALANPLFGRPVVAAAPTVTEPVETIRKSGLNIRVMGIVAGPGQQGVAILRHGSKIRSYAVGDRLDMQETIEVVGVLRDAVIIERSGRREKLELPALDAKTASAPARRRANTGPSSAAAPAAGREVALNSAPIRKLIGDPVETISGNPMKLLRFMYAQPVGNQGYRIKKGLDGRLLRNLGLKDGDIVTQVNNRPARNLGVGDIQSMLQPGRSIDLTILRDGKPEQVRLTL